MVNMGVAPLVLVSPVGRTRHLIGDVNYIPLVPDSPGYGNYTAFSDADIQAFLTSGNQNPLRGAGYALMQLSRAAVAESASVTSQDLRVDITRRATDYRLLAEVYLKDALEQEGAAIVAAAKADTYFSIVYPGRGTVNGEDFAPLSPILPAGVFDF